MKNILVILLISLFALSCQPKYLKHEASEPDPTIQWITGKNTAEAASIAVNKPLFIYYPNAVCSKEDQKALSSTEVVVLVQDNFVPYKSDELDKEYRFEIKDGFLSIAGPKECVAPYELANYIRTTLATLEFLKEIGLIGQVGATINE